MKLTIFGLTLSSSWGNGHATPYRAIIRALKGMGHEVTFYEKDVPYYTQHRDLRESPDCELILYSSWNEARPKALETARTSDAVITASYLPEGARINDELLAMEGPLHVYYDLDTPITLRQFREGRSVEYLRSDQLRGFDCVLSFVGGPILGELEMHYGVRSAAALYGCVDPDVHRRVTSRDELHCALSYMGTYAPDRQEKLETLFLRPAEHLPGERFVLAGSLYPWGMTVPENVRRVEHLMPGEHSALYSGSRLALNLTRAEMARWGFCPSGRFFESAACGTPVISDPWEGIEEFFVPGRELLPASSAQDIVDALSRDDLDAIGQRARERTLDEHTGQARAKQLLAALETVQSVETAR